MRVGINLAVKDKQQHAEDPNFTPSTVPKFEPNKKGYERYANKYQVKKARNR
ncbi:hypothetical protein JCM17380_49970 [Desulfosporosinus burensis]